MYNNKTLIMYYLLSVLTCLLIDKAILSHAFTYQKCCKSRDYLQIINNTYLCTENITKRLGILTNETNFLERYSEGECMDITSTDFSNFQVSGGKVVGESLINEKYFPKCCPLNYFYNSVLHACEEKENMTHGYIREIFVKVGLPSCKLIVDYDISETINLYSGIIDVRRNSDYCIDENEKGAYTMRECQENIEVCDYKKCIKKCCPDGKSFVNGANCVDTYTTGLNLTFSTLIENPSGMF
ncbi:hypothetical protein NQ314_019966 [Rhamnusium bicolor]|uniref:Uncharacterized protein n=1 Tax=Rhamnusium bicolor TaxID=1586634 RepID=A0AAV8WN29_9CUCU|nr:hypothetical protein NQ314_019966 [Rhamnusium bicolor]